MRKSSGLFLLSFVMISCHSAENMELNWSRDANVHVVREKPFLFNPRALEELPVPCCLPCPHIIINYYYYHYYLFASFDRATERTLFTAYWFSGLKNKTKKA